MKNLSNSNRDHAVIALLKCVEDACREPDSETSARHLTQQVRDIETSIAKLEFSEPDSDRQLMMNACEVVKESLLGKQVAPKILAAAKDCVSRI